MALNDSILRAVPDWTADSGDVLVVGQRVKRVSFYEGALTVAALNHEAGIVVLRREGHTSWINRAVGSKYSPATHIVCKFWLAPMPGTNKQAVMVRELCEASLKKPAQPGSSQ